MVLAGSRPAADRAPTERLRCIQYGTCVCKDTAGSNALKMHCNLAQLAHFMAPRMPGKGVGKGKDGKVNSQGSTKKPKKVKMPQRVLAEQAFLLVRLELGRNHRIDRLFPEEHFPWQSLAQTIADSASLPPIQEGSHAEEWAAENAAAGLQFSLFLHLGFMNFRTWQFTVTAMEFVRGDVESLQLRCS